MKKQLSKVFYQNILTTPYVVKITNRADIEDYFYDLIKDSLVKIL